MKITAFPSLLLLTLGMTIAVPISEPEPEHKPAPETPGTVDFFDNSGQSQSSSTINPLATSLCASTFVRPELHADRDLRRAVVITPPKSLSFGVTVSPVQPRTPIDHGRLSPLKVILGRKMMGAMYVRCGERGGLRSEA